MSIYVCICRHRCVYINIYTYIHMCVILFTFIHFDRLLCSVWKALLASRVLSLCPENLRSSHIVFTVWELLTLFYDNILEVYICWKVMETERQSWLWPRRGWEPSHAALSYLPSAHRSCLDPGLQLPHIRVAGEGDQRDPGHNCGGCGCPWRIPGQCQLEAAECECIHAWSSLPI